jgi:hypothetical protein
MPDTCGAGSSPPPQPRRPQRSSRGRTPLATAPGDLRQRRFRPADRKRLHRHVPIARRPTRLAPSPSDIRQTRRSGTTFATIATRRSSVSAVSAGRGGAVGVVLSLAAAPGDWSNLGRLEATALTQRRIAQPGTRVPRWRVTLDVPAQRGPLFNRPQRPVTPGSEAGRHPACVSNASCSVASVRQRRMRDAPLQKLSPANVNLSWPRSSWLDHAFPSRQGRGRWFEPSIAHSPIAEISGGLDADGLGAS